MEQRTFNTAIQGQALIAATNGLDIRALDFTNALQQLPAMTGSFAFNDEAKRETRLYVSDLVQSSVGHFLVNATGSDSAIYTNYCEIYIGPDTVEQATNYMSLFNLKTTSDVRILDFVKVNNVSDAAVALANNSDFPGTSNHVSVNGDYCSLLFGTSAKPGTHRLVSVQKISDTKVNFNILPGCCNDI